MAEATTLKPISTNQEQVKVDSSVRRAALDQALPDKVHTWPYLVRAEFIAGCVMILGLQEMLVYFDPWIAGVVLPSIIIVGLMVIPYVDINPNGNGYYTFQERKV